MNVLFVCTGNTCRSPMAEAVLKNRLRNEFPGLEAVAVSSAGVAAMEGSPATAEAIDVLSEIGVEPDGHSSRMLDGNLLAGLGEDSLIVAMARAHLDRLEMIHAPGEAEKITLLPEDIPDPMGRPVEIYREARDMIVRGVRTLIDERLLPLLPRKTPLYDTHLESGGKLVEFAGYLLPVRYGSIISEHAAVRNAAGLFDISHMGRIEIEGPGAAELLDRLLTNRFSDLGIGRARYSLLPNHEGGILDDLIVYRRGKDSFLLVVNGARRGTDLDHIRIEAAARPELVVEIRDITNRTAMIALQGPDSFEVAERISGLTSRGRGDARSLLASLPRYGFTDDLLFDGTPVMVSRTGYTGEDGLEFILEGKVAAALAAALWGDLVPAGARPAGLGARDVLRLEAAMPLYGHELDTGTDPFEAGLGWAVKMEKDDFIGREALAVRKAERRRRRAGLLLDGRAIPRAGHDVVDGDGTVIGKVTSGTHSPVLDRPICLAMIDKDSKPFGVVIRERLHAAEEIPLPFYKRG